MSDPRDRGVRVSRKRNRTAQITPDPAVPEAVPEDVLAEGSGPVQAICHVGIDAIGTDVAEAKTKGKAKGKSKRKPAPVVAEAEAATADAIEPDAIEASADTIEASAEAIEASADAIETSEATDASEPDAIEASAETPATDEGAELTETDSDEIAASSSTPTESADLAAEAGTEAAVEDGTAVLPTSAAELPPEQLKQLVEALVFASDKPMTLLRLRQLTRISDVKKLETTLAELAADYADRGLVLQQVSGGYQFRTRTEWSGWVQQLIAGRPVRLSRAQLETLAIVAYRQPITRPEIDDIRGVDSSATLKLLIDRELIRILGKKEEVGRPMLYGTTKEFLDFFSLGDLRELPTLREYSELTDESRQVITDRLGPADDDGEGGEGQGSPGGTPGGDAPAGDSGLEAAPATAADLIAAYVAELDAAAERAVPATSDDLDAVAESAVPAASDDDLDGSAERAIPSTFDNDLDAAAERAMLVTSPDELDAGERTVLATSDDDLDSVAERAMLVTSPDELDAAERTVLATSDDDLDASAGRAIRATSDDELDATAERASAISVDDLDASAQLAEPATAPPELDADMLFAEGTVDDGAPLELESVESVDSGSLVDLDPFATMAEGSGPIEASGDTARVPEAEPALVAEPSFEAISDGPDPSLLAADMAESADVPASSPGADPPQE